VSGSGKKNEFLFPHFVDEEFIIAQAVIGIINIFKKTLFKRSRATASSVDRSP
jgi:hypothetical protein